MSKCIVTDADWQEPFVELRGLVDVRRINAQCVLRTLFCPGRPSGLFLSLGLQRFLNPGVA